MPAGAKLAGRPEVGSDEAARVPAPPVKADSTAGTWVWRIVVVLLSIMGLIAVFLITTGILESPRQQTEATYWQNHTLEVLGAATKLDADLEKTVAEGRGFLIDRAAESVTRFEAAKRDVLGDVEALRGLTIDNATQQGRLRLLEPLVATRIAILSDVIEHLQRGDESRLQRNVQQKSGMSLMEPIEAAINEMTASERVLLSQRSETLRRAAQRTLFTMIGCSLALTSIGAITIFLLLGHARKRRYVDQLQLLAADLEKRVQERTGALAASEARFRMLSDNASDIVSLVAPDGTRVYASPAVERIFGITPRELIRDGLLTYTVAADRQRLAAATLRLLSRDVNEVKIQFRINRADGAEVWLDVIARAVPDPLTGSVSGYMSVSRDITEEHRAAVALQASEARYRALTENIVDAIVVFDLDLERTFVSPAFGLIFGYEPQEVLGAQPTVIVHPDDADDLDQHMRKVAAGVVERGQATYRTRHKLGHWIWVEANFNLVRDHMTGQPDSVISSLRDVSDRKTQAEALVAANVALGTARDEAEQANSAKSRFLAAMSHELRTPLNGILGYAQLLKLEGGLNPTQQSRVAAMLEAGSHLLEMINRVLELSQIEKDRGEARLSRTDLREVMHAALEVVRPLAQAKRLQLDVVEAAEAPRFIMTDTTRVRQVLLNLLGNAVKYTLTGAVTLRLRRVSSGAAVRIEVKDTGPGIPPDRRSRLFQDFERLGFEGSAAVEGAGVGLALSARLAAMIGGRVGHRDNPDGGSVFWLDVPVGESVDEASAALVSDAAAPPQGTRPSLRVLVVDDLAMNREIAGSFLIAGGHDVVYAIGGLEAVAAASFGNFDAVLMDVRMPEVDGLEATRRIRMLAGPRGRVPIIALTAQAFAEQVADCLAAGMDGHLAKPFVNDDLLAAVEAAVAMRRENRAAPVSTSPTDKDAESPLQPAETTLPIIDVGRFAATSAILKQEMLVSSLRSLTERCETLRNGLGVEGSVGRWTGGVADAAHTLAGSAGMFGFTRLADLAGRFNHAVEKDVGDAAELASSLVVAIDASTAEIQRRLPEGSHIT